MTLGVERLDHYSIRTTDIDTTRQFFVEALGFEDGYRPPFTFPGYWLYCGSHPTVHLIGIEKDQAVGSGAVDHMAFAATDAEKIRTRLVELGLEYRERRVPDLERHQIFVDDPNGITVELIFPYGENPSA